MFYSCCPKRSSVNYSKEQAVRTKSTFQMYLDFTSPTEAACKVVREYWRKYEKLNEVLLANPALLDFAHVDFCLYLSSSPGGRESRHTSEEILRTLVVFFVEGDAYRDLVVRIENSDFLRGFVGLGFFKAMMDFSFVAKAFAALSEETWKKMNEVLARYAEAECIISADQLRTDTTAYEVNIHYPTDSSLLWDSFRVLTRVLRQVQQQLPELGLKHRFHDKKVKKLAFFIARNAGSKSKRTRQRVRSAYRKLIERVRWIVGVSKEVREKLVLDYYEAPELTQYEPIAERIVDQAQRRIFDGEVVPASEKVYSLFEEHTELLIRGKAGKPVEFGHKVLVAQTGEKFISHYRVLEQREEDNTLLPEVLDAHHSLFGEGPAVLAADKGFYKSVKQLAEPERDIETVSICKKGRRSVCETARETDEAFQEGQRFRAGVEGSISVLKRAFKLNRCLFKGYRHFASSVGAAVLCHNLVLLTRL